MGSLRVCLAHTAFIHSVAARPSVAGVFCVDRGSGFIFETVVTGSLCCLVPEVAV